MSNTIVSKEGFDHQIGILVSEMEYVRNETYRLISAKKLTIKDLDFNFDALSNSIGTILLHIATHEFKFQLNHFYKRGITEAEYEKYLGGMPFMMHKRLISGNDLAFYIEELKTIRENTLANLKKMKDDWLFEDVITSSGKNIGNNYYLFRHVVDDEINHQGQIKMILKRISNNL